MSFGFKKKHLLSAGGATGKKANAKERERQRQAEADADAEAAAAAAGLADQSLTGGDDNGNTDEPTGRTTPRLTPPRKESNGGPYRSIRFGFRQSNVVRPASTGLHAAAAQTGGPNSDNASNNNIAGTLAGTHEQLAQMMTLVCTFQTIPRQATLEECIEHHTLGHTEWAAASDARR